MAPGPGKDHNRKAVIFGECFEWWLVWAGDVCDVHLFIDLLGERGGQGIIRSA